MLIMFLLKIRIIIKIDKLNPNYVISVINICLNQWQ